MASRYPHWLGTAEEGQWPTGVITVDCQSELVSHKHDRHRSVDRLLSWHSVGMVRRANDYGEVVSTSGRETERWWSMLAEQAAHHASLWVVSYRCSRVWALLGLWERLEDGRIDPTGHDSRNTARRALGLSPESAGYLVCEDPPCIIRARVYAAQYPITWIDVRNYGVEQVGEVAPGHATASWLADWIREASALCRRLGLGAICATAGSQAMRAFRHTYYSGGIYCDTDTAAERLCEAAYSGGRCEARLLGTIREPHRHLDIRSSYGAVCANHRVPIRLQDHSDNHGGADPTAGADPLEFLARVQLSTGEPAYPHRRGQLTRYPTGRFWSTLCGPELKDAVHRGRVARWGEYARYELGYALRHYAICLYDARSLAEKSRVPGIKEWLKRLLVSLPGKLGQRDRHWVDAPNHYTDVFYGEWLDCTKPDQPARMRSLAGVVQREVSGGFAADAVPAAAAWVTSWGRMALLNAIRTAGWEEVYYYDTDSLITTDQGYANLCAAGMCAEKTLGLLEVRASPERTDIRGIKYYVQDGIVTCSGIPRGQNTDLGDGKTYTRRLSPAEQARKGQRPGAVVIVCHYQRGVEYALGTANADGTVTPPHIVED